ncbi:MULTISPECIES: aspartate/glutamate racemase family protein [unclassified Mesorhizobium]|uniref:aspartate/glutamate racemase family protein n=1 Tax=unclassified Mesorhizobium TaxID=325217 RepID=UPI0003CF62EF|nr:MULTISPECIES: aspartate/glutamate racemase family protein [unclassified Mesorhizobium]ESY19185.1 Asp/Glu/hydantoin racemase [Mesorhizobium sp. LNJC391B00]ESY58006.1 Asp/Glu/hydantoin racemase [Mesorhizobium sp. LNJC374B00]ESY58852.1 Asp/Glu/hydantoin racemase [Mesorhizobium sp. LNJC372A00]WJI79486.1 aspartate/glutamate racemase family protein [Mesorhizobium sp. C374B]WJI86021.1 aspartate/glutamate racemase family protein [Mesorhizobium sp. C372A]
MQILVVNPNTTASMTETIAAAARGVAGAGTEVIAVTSSMGPASIEGYYDEALAVPGLLMEIAAGERAGAQAAIIACFDDTGLDAARAMASIPVIGICEAALSVASYIAQRFTVVTTTERSRVPVEGLVQRYGMAGRTRVRAADIPVLSLEDAASGAVEKLRAEIARAIAEDRAEAIVLGCAGMADLAHRLQQEFDLPVIDGVGAALKQAEALIALGLSTSKRGSYASPLAKPYRGVLKSFSPGVVAAE